MRNEKGQFVNGHTLGIQIGQNLPNKGMPRGLSRLWREKFIGMMKDMAVDRTNKEDLKELHDLAIKMAKNGSFEHYKFIVEREDQYNDIEIPRMESLNDVPSVALEIGNFVLEKKMAAKKAKAVTDVLKDLAELNIKSTLDDIEEMKKA